MGVAGAAASTLISRALEFLILAFYVLKMDKKLSLRVKDLLLRSSRLLKDFFLYGAPVILGDIFWGLGGAAQTAILGRLDGAVISAGAITMSIYMVFTVMVYGISSAGSLVVGQEIGRNGFDLAKRYTKTLQLVYLSVGICSSLLLFLLADKALLLYPGITAEAKVYAGRFLNIMGIMLIGTSYQMASLQIVRAGGATHFVLINDLIFVWLVVIPSASLAAFVFKTPPEVVFACLKCDQILKCFVAVVKVNRFKWMKNLTQTRLEPNKTPA
jgi:Na+-driven multidrug efflux pump